MKKIMLVLAVAAIAFTGCNKEQDLSGYATTAQLDELRQQMEEQQTTKLYEFTVNFPAIENDYFSQAQYNGLRGKVKKTDALLVYANIAGAWTQLPYCLNNMAVAYWRTDDGTLYFRYGRANYVEVTQDAESMSMRAIVIAQDLSSKLAQEGVDMNNCDAVIDACQKMQIPMSLYTL